MGAWKYRITLASESYLITPPINQSTPTDKAMLAKKDYLRMKNVAFNCISVYYIRFINYFLNYS